MCQRHMNQLCQTDLKRDRIGNDVTIYFEPDPKKERRTYWICAAMSGTWLIQAYAHLTASDASRTPYGYFLLVTGIGMLSTMAYLLLLRSKHGRMRLSITDEELSVKDSEKDPPRSIAWNEVIGIAFRLNRIELQAESQSLEIQLVGSYTTNQEVKETIAQFADAHGIAAETR